MARKFYTCIIVPDTSQRLHKLRVPIRALYLLAAIGVLSFFVTVGLGFHYVGMSSRMENFAKLEADNAKLNVDTRQLRVTISQLTHQVAELESQAETITKAIQEDPILRKLGAISRSQGGSRSDVPTSDLGFTSLGSVEALKARSDDLDGEFAWIRLVLSSRNATPSIWPVEGRIGSHFGRRPDPFTGESELHWGIDLAVPKGTPVRAAADGRVFFARRQAEYGNLVVLEHPNGYTTRYGHLFTFNVREEQIVHRGDIIGYVGMTGRATAPHLHYEVRLNDQAVNPRTFLLK
jgi:murein DD-endopeptidase MepM/ murein hydrolase activator NlpD